MTDKNISKIWGGRFTAGPSEIMTKINQSIDFDKKLYREDIEASIAHSKMLAKQNIVTNEESIKIIDALLQIKEEIKNKKFNFKYELEDIHMNIEHRLSELIGEIAGKLHIARSRNDQVATDLRLYIRKYNQRIIDLLIEMQKVILKKSEDNIDIMMPGFTHLQIAQPILFSHYLLAYFEMFDRDIERLKDNHKRINISPLGSAALSGTSFNIDRKYTAKLLNFDDISYNSIDAVSDRDFAIEFLSNLSIIAMHLSRFAEEIIIYSSKAYDFFKLPDYLSSGSSIMPQKRNPDSAELVRGKTSRIYASLFNLLSIMKSISLSYFKDMQEDKEPVFDAVENIINMIIIISDIFDNLKINKINLEKYASLSYSTATDIADYLVKKCNISFRSSHHITGNIVKYAENNKKELKDLTLLEFQNIYSNIDEDIYDILSVRNSINSKKSLGGTATENVIARIKFLSKKLNK